jgi:tetratricopeptide (TPR) repeat protein
LESKLCAALAAAPDSFDANRELGLFYLNAERYRESVQLLQIANRIDPANYENELDLALALKTVGDPAESRKHVVKLLRVHDSAGVRRLAGEIDEMTGDPLAAVHEFEQAVRLDPSEINYFEWGSELMLHRAVLQAQDVFQAGATLYPHSSRMLTALGTALFGGARYDDAAQRLCEASDLMPADPEPYFFMGKVEIAAPSPLKCVDERLARFVALQPDNSLANYFYAMAVWKARTQTMDQARWEQAVALLTKAVAIDPKCADAFLQLGILYSSRHDTTNAIGYYTKAVEANPELADAYYRLAVEYDRIGETAKAAHEFELHDQLKKQQAAEVERQRREVKQFLVAGQPTYPATK